MSQTQIPPLSQTARRPTEQVSPVRPQDRGQFFMTAGLWALAVLILAATAYKRFFALPNGPGILTDPNAMDYAQIARNMANGHGFATGILRPLAVTGFAGPDRAGVAPDVSHAPLYSFLLMIAFKAHSGHGGDNIVILAALALFLLSVVAVYWLARVLFPAPEQIWVALLSAGLYGVGGEGLTYALSGVPVGLATLLVTTLLIALFRSADAPGQPARIGSAVSIGVLLGLCYLTQYSLILLALPVFLYVFFSRAPSRAWAGVGACAVAFLMITGPWLIRNARISHGDPFFTLLFYGVMANTPAYPGDSTIYRSVAPTVGPLAYFYTHMPDMLGRVGRGLTYYREHLLEAFNFFLLAAAAASLLWRAPDVRVNAVRTCAAVGIFLVVIVTSIFQPTIQMIAPFAPIITVVAVGFVFSLVVQQDWEPLLQRTAIWSLGVLVGLGGLIQFVGQQPAPADPIANGMALLTGAGPVSYDNPSHQPGQAVISDAPWEITWRASVPAVWLPANNEAYQAVASTAGQSGVPIWGMLLTPKISDYGVDPNDSVSWRLLSTHPNAFADHEKADNDLIGLARLIAHNDPRVRQYTIRNTKDAVIRWLSEKKDDEDRAYETNYGLISDIVNDFQVQLTSSEQFTVTEANGLPSELFERHTVSSAK